MNSNFRSEVVAVLKKEYLCEIRGKGGWQSAGLFLLVSTIILSVGLAGEKLSGGMAAAVIWALLLFASSVGLPRTFLHEEEQGTADLLRIYADAGAVFLGKALFNLAQSLVAGTILSFLFFLLTEVTITDPGQYILSLLGGCIAISASMTLCAALVAQAAYRSALVGAIALPLLVPVAILGVSAMKTSMGSGLPEVGRSALLGLIGYGVFSFAVGPPLFRVLWAVKS